MKKIIVVVLFTLLAAAPVFGWDEGTVKDEETTIDVESQTGDDMEFYDEGTDTSHDGQVLSDEDGEMDIFDASTGKFREFDMDES